MGQCSRHGGYSWTLSGRAFTGDALGLQFRMSAASTVLEARTLGWVCSADQGTCVLSQRPPTPFRVLLLPFVLFSSTALTNIWPSQDLCGPFISLIKGCPRCLGFCLLYSGLNPWYLDKHLGQAGPQYESFG